MKAIAEIFCIFLFTIPSCIFGFILEYIKRGFEVGSDMAKDQQNVG